MIRKKKQSLHANEYNTLPILVQSLRNLQRRAELRILLNLETILWPVIDEDVRDVKRNRLQCPFAEPQTMPFFRNSAEAIHRSLKSQKLTDPDKAQRIPRFKDVLT